MNHFLIAPIQPKYSKVKFYPICNTMCREVSPSMILHTSFLPQIVLFLRYFVVLCFSPRVQSAKRKQIRDFKLKKRLMR